MLIVELKTSPVLEILPKKAVDALHKVIENNSNRIYLLNSFFNEFINLDIKKLNFSECKTANTKFINYQTVEKVNKSIFLTDLMVTCNETDDIICILKRKMPIDCKIELPKTECSELVFDFNRNLCFIKDDKQGLTSTFSIEKRIKPKDEEELER